MVWIGTMPTKFCDACGKTDQKRLSTVTFDETRQRERYLCARCRSTLIRAERFSLALGKRWLERRPLRMAP